MVLFTTLSVNAQKMFVCTGNNVIVRTGPGKNYKAVNGVGGAHCTSGRILLAKGEHVLNGKVMKNGYVKVSCADPSLCWDEGWVASQYLKAATPCSRCHGKGTTGRKCPECHGEGAWVCCYYTGVEFCPKCGGVGYN